MYYINKVIFFNNLDWGPVPRLPPGALQPVWLIVQFPIFLNVPPLSARCLSRPQLAVAPWQPEEELWARNGGQMVPGICTQGSLHAANLRHGTDNFTSLPKEGRAGDFYRPLKIRRL